MPVHISFCVFFFFCFFPLQRNALGAPSDSYGSCKMKVTVPFLVTIPTARFLFHWSQTPDFTKSKNRLLQTPPLSPFPHPYSFPLLRPALASTCQEKKKALCLHSKWETLVSKTFYVMESFCSQPDKRKKKQPKVIEAAFSESCKSDLRAH